MNRAPNSPVNARGSVLLVELMNPIGLAKVEPAWGLHHSQPRPSHELPTLVRVPCAFHGCRLVAMYTKLGGLNDDARKAGFSHTDLLNG